MSFSTKQEKKIMEEKINKVREVVRNFSTNDIVLALHYFELDVEKTIQAFLQGTSLGVTKFFSFESKNLSPIF